MSNSEGESLNKFGDGQQDDNDTIVQKLQEENKRNLIEFNSQRAKLKELFTKKETELIKSQEAYKQLECELNDLKSRFVLVELNSENELHFKESRAQEEISSLQHIVHETMEENLSLKSELDRLQLATNQISQHSHNVLETANMGTEKSTGETTSTSNGTVHELVGEDSELLSSIVVQLQAEMKILKEKLREADARNTDDANSTNEQPDQKVVAMEATIADLQENLTKEVALRKILENQWQEKREEHKNEVMALRSEIGKVGQNMMDAERCFAETKQEMLQQLSRLIDDRESINNRLETLQLDNDFLSGRNLATAEEIESQKIDLPNNVVELQEFILRQQQIELVQARVAIEYERKKYTNSLEELKILQEKYKTAKAEQRNVIHGIQAQNRDLVENLRNSSKKLLEFDLLKAAFERKEAELGRKISEMRVEIIELQEQKEKLVKSNNDKQKRIKNMQDDLATSEQVQKDFVKLSQNLQISLEALRGADCEVRWQEDDDVSACPTCQTKFTVTVRRLHCRHCGRIYCDKCLSKTVESGPRKRIARVCDVCHTLLSPNTAPYFSHSSSSSKLQA